MRKEGTHSFKNLRLCARSEHVFELLAKGLDDG